MAHYISKPTDKEQNNDLYFYMEKKHLPRCGHNKSVIRASRPRANSLCPQGSSDIHEHRRKSSSSFDLVYMQAKDFLNVPNQSDCDEEEDEVKAQVTMNDNKTQVRRSSSFKEHKEGDSGGLRRVRSFKTTSKGLVNRGDTLERREMSPKGNTHQNKAVDRTLHVFNNYVIPQLITTKIEGDQSYFRVLMSGARNVGKTSIIDQFMTSEFLCCGDISISAVTAFSVSAPASVSEGKEMHNLQEFKTVYVNGGDFNIDTGIFTCSTRGMYYFTTTLVKRGTGKERLDQVYCHIYKNKLQQLRVKVDQTDDDTDLGNAAITNSIILSLDIGDIVYLGSCSPIKHFAEWTSFSGFLLYPES